jgi:alcohol dehydrogenase class IV
VATNVKALRARAPESPALDRYRWIAAALTNEQDAAAEDAAAPLLALAEVAAIPSLGNYGITTAAHPTLVARAKKASSMAGNPLELTDRELHEILERAQ